MMHALHWVPRTHFLTRGAEVDITRLLDKHPKSVTKWLDRGLRLERDDSDFKRHLDRLDAALSKLS